MAGVSHVSAQAEPSSEDSGTATGDAPLASRLGELAREFQREQGTAATLTYLVSAAVALIPGVEQASISIVFGRKVATSEYPTGPLPAAIDAIQTETGQGPCLDAAFEHQTVRVNDLRAASDRWPLFAPRAVAAGVRSMLSFQLYVEGDNLGALNLFSTQVDAFTDESEHVGLLFATHAAIAFAATRHNDEMHRALVNRDVIGQAKGLLMERYHVPAERAFLILSRLSQETNTKLSDAAADLVRTRTMPGQHDRPPAG